MYNNLIIFFNPKFKAYSINIVDILGLNHIFYDCMLKAFKLFLSYLFIISRKLFNIKALCLCI